LHNCFDLLAEQAHMALRDFEPYFPDRPPCWSELLFGGVIGVAFLPNMVATLSSLSTVIVAFVLTTVALASEAVEDWFYRIGMAGRFLLIAGVFMGVQLVAELAPAGRPLLNDIATGVLLATLLYFIAFLARERTVSGWTATREPAE